MRPGKPTRCAGCHRDFTPFEKVALMAFTPQAWPDRKYPYPLCRACVAAVDREPRIRANIEAWLVHFNPELGQTHQPP
jgi:hypothetical protein